MHAALRRLNQVRNTRHRPQESPPQVQWRAVLEQWMAEIDGGGVLKRDRDRVEEYAADVVETLVQRPSGTHGALCRFGYRLGADGWPLDQISSWIDLLEGNCDRPAGHYLRTFQAGIALANGWNDGTRRGIDSTETFDPSTGLCTPPVLRLRLEQVFERCRVVGVHPGLMYRLVIVDADLVDSSSLERSAVMAVLSNLVQRSFSAGETLARDGGRIFVLVEVGQNDQLSLEVRLDDLLTEARVQSLLRDAHVMAWAEELPEQPAHLDRYMADLAI